VPTLADNMPTREIFPSLETAMARWATIVSYPDAVGVRPFITGLTIAEDGSASIDPTLYPESHEVMIGKLTEKAVTTKNADGTTTTTPGKTNALYFHPVPRLESMLDEAHIAELRDILQKEWQLRAVRTIRNLKGNYTDESATAEAADKMPRTVDEYCNGSRTGSGLLDAFNKLALPTLKRFKELPGKGKPLADAFKLANLSKNTLRLALSNAAYARTEYKQLENFGAFKTFLQILIKDASAPGVGLSVTTFESWLATRDAQSYDPTQIDLSGVDLDALFSAAPEGDEAGEPDSDEDEAGEVVEPTEPTEPTA